MQVVVDSSQTAKTCITRKISFELVFQGIFSRPVKAVQYNFIQIFHLKCCTMGDNQIWFFQTLALILFLPFYSPVTKERPSSTILKHFHCSDLYTAPNNSTLAVHLFSMCLPVLVPSRVYMTTLVELGLPFLRT